MTDHQVTNHDPAAEAAPRSEPMTISLVAQMSGLHAPGIPDKNFAGHLDMAAESWCRYFVAQMEKLTAPRGGDLFVALSVQRGDESHGHEYREGRYLKGSEVVS